MNEICEPVELKLENIVHKLFRNSSEGVLIVDHNNLIHTINPRVEQIFGCQSRELIGKNVNTFIPGIDDQFHNAEYTDNKIPAIARSYTLNREALYNRTNKESISLKVSTEQLNYDDSIFYIVLVRDNSAQNIAEAECLSQKATAQRYLDISGTMFVMLDRNQNLVMINKTGCECLGYEEGELLGRNLFELILPKNKVNPTKELFRRMLKGEKRPLKNFLATILTRNKGKRYILWHTTVVIDKYGQITGTLSSGEDITRQKMAEEKLKNLNLQLEYKISERTAALEENQRIYNLITRNFPNGLISIIDRKMNYIFTTGEQQSESHLKRRRKIGSGFLSGLNEEVRDHVRSQLLKVFAGNDISFEFNTGKKIFMIFAVGLRSPEGNINQILLVSQNITSLKRAEFEILKSLNKEKHLNELKSRFVSMASHEFRTPLTTILNSASIIPRLIPESNQTEKLLQQVNRIKTSVNDLSSILNDFLSLEKLEGGKITLNHTNFDFQVFGSSIVREMASVAKSDQVISYSHTGIRSIVCDKQLLKIACQNLLSNAIKYSPEKSRIWMNSKCIGTSLEIKIIDEGIGIPEEEQVHIFKRFFRAKNALNLDGTGLGLNIVKKYLEMVKGEIEFESGLNEGTTFSVTIPECVSPIFT